MDELIALVEISREINGLKKGPQLHLTVSSAELRFDGTMTAFY